MSEPMSSVEIEDVLSSIRRLVSEDLRPKPEPAAQAPVAERPAPAISAAAAEAVASKLILTPALRIVTPDPAPTEVDTADRWHDGAWPQVEDARFVAVEDDSEYHAEPAPAATVLTLTPAAPVAAEVEAEVANPEEAPAPAVSSAPDMDEPLQESPPEVAEPAAWPDRDEDLSPQDAAWADAAEAEVLRQLADDGAASYAVGATDEDMVYEETVLRELVRDIIREELQGALGERITRNVRKLVRAEIARAMALRDFE